jgi:hypothetical protein
VYPAFFDASAHDNNYTLMILSQSLFVYIHAHVADNPCGCGLNESFHADCGYVSRVSLAIG